MKLDPKHYEHANESSREQVLRNALRGVYLSTLFRHVDKEYEGPKSDQTDSLTEMIRRTRTRLARERNGDNQKIIKFESEGERLIKRLKK